MKTKTLHKRKRAQLQLNTKTLDPKTERPEIKFEKTTAMLPLQHKLVAAKKKMPQRLTNAPHH